MRKLYFFAAFIVIGQFGIQAQVIVNSNFENWTPSGNPAPFDWESPTNWKSTNSQTEWTSAGVRKTTDSYDGLFACQLISVPISGAWPSAICNGNPDLIGSSFSDPGIDIITGGTPINIKPNKLTGYYKFDNNDPLDLGYAKVILKKYNTTLNRPDTVGMGDLFFQETAAYAPFEIIINDLMPQMVPDSIVIAFYSTNPDDPKPYNPPSIGLIIDSLSLVSGTASVKKGGALNINPIVYPNPAKGRVMIGNIDALDYSVGLYNMKGQKLMSASGEGSLDLDVSGMAPGLYYVKIEGIETHYSMIKSVVIE